ncbi:MAG TPA: YdcF family protein [Pyrinomonadaceae bacterium]|nr:YdcF family protein [Pyrinomonadaceae bacterium]
MQDSSVTRAAQTLWSFMSQQDDVGRPSTIFVFGSTDLIVAAFAAALYFRLKPEAIVCSGGLAHEQDLLSTGWDASEADIMADVLRSFGVPPELIHVENNSKNTGENFDFSLSLARDAGLNLSDLLVLHKPYMTLRTKLTGTPRLRDLPFRVAAPLFSFEQYSRLIMPAEKLLNIMTGDFQRIVEYPKKGFSAACSVPPEVQAAFDALVQAGYTKHLLRA